MFSDILKIKRIHAIIFVDSRYTPVYRNFSGKFSHNELIFKLSGEVKIELGSEVFYETENNLRFFPATDVYTTYTVETIKPGQCIDIIFDTETPIKTGVFSMPAKYAHKLRPLFIKAENVWKQKRKGYYYSAMSCLYEILSILENDVPYINSAKVRKINEGVKYLTEHFTDTEIRLDRLGEMCNISYVYFKKLFRKHYNMSPKAYLIHLRIQHACDLLKYNDFSISSISEMVGYQNVYYFSKSFKKAIGISPSEYRKKYS